MRKATLGYPLHQEYIHHWLVAGPQVIPVEGSPQFWSPEDRLQIARRYHLPEPGIHGLPIEHGEYKIGEVRDKWRYVRTPHDHLIDLTSFQPFPGFLRAWAYAEIESPQAQEIDFVLTTQGPADLWINEQHVHRQEHFHAQRSDSLRFQAQLQNGRNRLMVRFEQVAVGECPYGMALQLLGFRPEPRATARIVHIPTGAPSLRYRRKLEQLFEDCHLRQDVYTRQDQIMVYLPEGEVAATPFNIRMQMRDGPIYAEARRDGTRTEPRQPMGFPFQFAEGSHQLRFLPPPEEFYEKNVRITRTRDFYAATNIFSAQPYGTYPERRAECLKDAARRKNNLFSEIAKMELSSWSDVDPKVVQKAIGDVRSRSVNSEIQLCGLLGMLYRYADHESFPTGLRQPLEECVLGFRYWEDEPGSDAMDYRGESHSITFLTCEILAGQRYRERVFMNAEQSGQWHLEKGTRLALEWLHKRASDGFDEWDSHSSFEVDVLSLSTLASLAEDPQTYEPAALVLDKMFFTIAINSFKGVFGSSHGNTSASQIKTGYREATSGISRLLWGMGIFNEHILGSVSLACSSYELPSVIAAVATDQPEELWSKEQHPGVNKVTYKTPDGMLCSAQDWHPGEPGQREHIWQATLGPLVTIFTSHPACASENDWHRPNYWQGNASLPRVAQWKDTLIAIYHFADADWMGFTHAYFPVHGMDEYHIQGGWAFGKVGDGYIAVSAAGGLHFQTDGDNAYRELRSPGSPSIWLCQMGRAAVDDSFQAFIENVLALPVTFGGDQVQWTTLRGDHLDFDWEGSFMRNGEALPLKDFKHYDNPCCTCAPGASVMEIQHAGDALRLHFEHPHPETDSQ